MNVPSIPIVIMASISFYVGFYHLLIYGRRRQHREDLTFALLCLATSLYDVFCIGLYNSPTVAEGVQWQRAQFMALPLFTTAFMWFVSDYTHQKPGPILYAFSAFFLLAIFVQLVDRSELTWLVDSPSIKEALLPLGLKITYHEATFGPFTTVQSLAGLAASTYIVVKGIRFYRRGYRREAAPLLLAMGFVYATALNDTAVSNGLYQFVYTIEYGYMAMILLMTYSLSSTVVETAMAKQALRTSEERFRSLVETTSDWVWEIDRSGVYTYVSPKVGELLGYEPQDIIGKTPFDLMPPDEAKHISATFREIMNGPRPFARLENVAQCKDGRLVVLETSGVPFFDANGKLLGYRGIDRDITERKRAEEALRERESIFRSFVEQTSEGIMLLDEQGSVVEWNHAVELVTGIRREEVLGKPAWDFQFRLLPRERKSPAAYERLKSSYLDILHSGISPWQDRSLEAVFQRADGSERIVEQRLFPIKTNKGFSLGGVSRDITERKQSEETLQMFQYTIDRASDAVQWLNRDAGFEYVNDQACRSLGYTREELMHLRLWDIDPIYPKERWDANWEGYQDGRRGGSENVETLHRRKDGSVFPVEVQSNHLWFGDRELHVAVVRDITERKRAEMALQESEEKFRSVVENSPTGIFLVNDAFQFTYVNDELCRILGYSRAEIIGCDFRKFLDEDSRPIVADRYVRRRSGEDVPPRYEFNIVRKGGEKRRTEISSAVIKDSLGNLRTMGQLLDITERKRAEEALREKTAELDRYFTNALDLLCIADTDGYFRRLNQEWESTLGYSVQELEGTQFLDYVHPDDREATLAAISRLGEQREVLNFVNRYRSKDGSYHWIEWRSSPVGNTIYAAARDITERKQAEAERENLIKELEAKNAELEQFTYTVSHDLKAPLITIRGFIGLLEKDALAGNFERVRSDIERISSATDKMQRLLNELLELSRIGRLMNPSQAVPFETIAREAVELVGGQLNARGVEVEIAADLPTVYGDRARLVEVVQNLVDNAIKFMGDQAEPRITIGQRGAERNGKPILFVRDNGVGIEPAYHERIFGLFNKLDPQGEGTGVGLALVKRIVEAHGGKIWVESEGKSKGATFCFTLPLEGTG